MAKPKSPAKAPKSTRQRVLGALKWVAIVGLSVVLLGAGIVGIAYATTPIPNPNSDFQTNTTFVYYRDGKTELGTFAVQNRVSIPLAEMPNSIKDAVVAAENRTFWTDPGISASGLMRAVWSIVSGGDVVGGSTITQQYIKVLYLSSDRTFTRKFKELILAAKIGNEVPKEQILEGYLNTIYFGRGAYGVEAAAQAYFNTSAKKLTVPQAAVLAAILNNPGYLDPSGGAKNIERLTERYHYVLGQMAETGKITTAQRDEYAKSLPKFPEIPADSRYGGPKGFLLRMVADELSAAGLTDAQINGGGLKIVTTFDAKDQAAAVKAAQDHTNSAAKEAGKPAKGLHAAIASVDTATGGVLALYGGPDYVNNSRNWARTDRPTASTFKAFAVLAALRNGVVLSDRFNGNTFTPRGDGVPIRNAGGEEYGEVTLLKATTDSINTAFVDLTQQMPNGPQNIIKAANDVGVPTGAGWDANNRIALGTAEASPLEMAAAYATFANNGKRITAHVVREVTDADGNSVYKADEKQSQAISADDARDVTYALSTVVEDGTGKTVDTMGRDVAGKTGTGAVPGHTVSSWLVAYTKQISTAVMFVAGDDGNGDLDAYRRPGDAWFYSSVFPTAVWSDYMEVAMAGLPNVQFDGPSDRQPKEQPTEVVPRTTQAPATSKAPTPTVSAPATSAPATSAPATSAPPATSKPPATSAPATSRGPTGKVSQAGSTPS